MKDMKSTRTLLLLTFLLCSSLGAQAQSPFLDSNAEAIQSFLDRNFRNASAGMVIGLVDEHGTRIFSSGKPDNGSDQFVDGNTVFEMGSVTKVFTSLLLLDAVYRGEMKLDAPVADYLPDGVKIPECCGKQITLLNLAVQESGLPWHPPEHERILDFESGNPDHCQRHVEISVSKSGDHTVSSNTANERNAR